MNSGARGREQNVKRSCVVASAAASRRERVEACGKDSNGENRVSSGGVHGRRSTLWHQRPVVLVRNTEIFVNRVYSKMN